MRTLEVIEQTGPRARPYRATYTFYDDGSLSSFTRPLSKGELEFYTRPDVNRKLVKHMWLDNPLIVDESLQKLAEADDGRTQRSPSCTESSAPCTDISDTAKDVDRRVKDRARTERIS